MGSLQGRRALITGSFQGIGFGVATAFAREGADIVLHGLSDRATINAAESAILKAGANSVLSFTSDLRNQSATEKMIDEIQEKGNVDILCNNAGIQFTATFSDMPRPKWDDVIAINLSSYFDTMLLLLPGMKERGYGRVINIASVHGLVASVAKAPYVAAKHGLIGLTRVAALEYADSGTRESGGVTINAICPGWVETALIEPQIQARAAKFGGDRDKGISDLLSEKQPSRRLATPEDIGALALFLTSKLAHNITGAAIPVDGGWTAQ